MATCSLVGKVRLFDSRLSLSCRCFWGLHSGVFSIAQKRNRLWLEANGYIGIFSYL